MKYKALKVAKPIARTHARTHAYAREWSARSFGSARQQLALLRLALERHVGLDRHGLVCVGLVVGGGRGVRATEPEAATQNNNSNKAAGQAGRQAQSVTHWLAHVCTGVGIRTNESMKSIATMATHIKHTQTHTLSTH